MRHPYHLIEPSPLPILISMNLLYLLLGLIGYLTGYLYGLLCFQLSLILLIYIISLLLYDVITESLSLGYHSLKVSRGLIYGFLLFLLTEIMLFFSFFLAYFHSAFNPTELILPPVGIDSVNPLSIPLLNTFLLLYSGIAATLAHHSFIARDSSSTILSLGISLLLGLAFVILQGFEYYYSPFDISDSSYSSAFYMLTGLHGMHVIVGLTSLFVVFYRVILHNKPSLTFDLAVLYLHFVDIVLIFLFVVIYYMAY